MEAESSEAAVTSDTVTRSGEIYFKRHRPSADPAHVIFTAQLQELSGYGEKCSVVAREGACEITTCVPNTGERRLRPVSAGTITFAAGDRRLQLLPGVFADPPSPHVERGIYDNVTHRGLFVADGEQLTYSASGAEVPAFERVVTMMTKVKLTEPTWTNEWTPITVRRDQDVVLRWDTASSGTLTAYNVLSETEAESGEVTSTTAATCKWSAAERQGTFPKEVLARLAPGQTIDLGLSHTVADEFVLPGGWKIHANFDWDIVAGGSIKVE